MIKKYLTGLAAAMIILSACSPKADAPKTDTAAEAPKAEAPKPDAAPEAPAPSKADSHEVPPAPADPAAEMEKFKAMSEVSGPFSPKGLALIMGTRLETEPMILSVRGQENSYYKIEKMLDGLIVFSTDRRPKSAQTKEQIIAAVSDGRVDARDFTAEKDEAMTAKTGFPSWKISYLSGHNEDTSSNIDYYFQGKEYDYNFHVNVGADWFEENLDMINAWISGLKFEDRQ